MRETMKMKLTFFVVFLMVGLGMMVLSAGCAGTPRHQEVMTFLQAKDHIASGSGYVLAPPDIIAVISPHAPELDASVQIRHDGTVHLPLLGDIRVAGLTAREAAAKLQQELGVYYRDPVVHVSISQYASKFFYLYGDVGGGSDRGGRQLPITGRDTVMNILTQAGLPFTSWVNKVRVIRPDKDNPGKNVVMELDFEKMMTMGDHTQDILLQEGDIVYIPPTPQAWFGYRIRELLMPVAPALEAYRTPSTIMAADEVYANEEDDNNDDNNNNNNNLNGAANLLSVLRP